MTGEEEKKPTWTRAEDKLFEAALVRFDGVADEERWRKIAAEVPGKSPEEIRLHYEALVFDLDLIEAGRVELPEYPDEPGSTRSSAVSPGSGNRRQRQSEAEKKKGTPWTEEEHRRFLIGLEKYGKGDWRSISRNVVMTRTPTQVASHAQKYFLRQSSVKKERKRTSIHDITTPAAKSTATPASRNPPHGKQAAAEEPFNPNHGFPV